MSYLYFEFHSHLPEELFFDDFSQFIKKAFPEAKRCVASYASDDPQLDLILSQSKLETNHPERERLHLYIDAHMSYLDTLTYQQLIEDRVHWGLNKLDKLC